MDACISIIVPVYNNEETLEATLHSLFAQTYAPLEIVCVNDGSRDGSAAILDDFAKAAAEMDGRISFKVITQDNAGLPAARNAGMAAMTGDIVMFVDADDMLVSDACLRVAAQFSRTPAIDLVVFGAVCVPEEKAPNRLRELLAPEHNLYLRDYGTYAVGKASEKFLFHANTQPYVWRSAYRKSFLDANNIIFDAHLRFAEDVPFMLLAFSLANMALVIPDKLYRYVMADTSLTHTLNTAEHRVEKADWHIEAIKSLLHEWCARDIAELYLGETIEWAIDLLLFDFANMPPADAVRLGAKFASVMSEAYGTDWTERYARDAKAHGATVVAAKKMAQCSKTGELKLTKMLLSRFYLETRGLKACIKRVLSPFRRGGALSSHTYARQRGR